MKKLTNEEFIERAKIVHGDKYDYSETLYINNRTNIDVKCPKHGTFVQSPKTHLKGGGCTKCWYERVSYTNEEFIEKSKLAHKDKYDYSETVYIGIFDKVSIICPKHGLFNQRPSDHLQGRGCVKCANDKLHLDRKKPNEQFIEESKAVHGDRYDYSKVGYVNKQSPVTIICKQHGEFEQVPNVHLIGGGCSKCFYEKIRFTDEEFVENAKIVHGDKYDYSRVNYINSNEKVEIICKQHGSFFQSPSSHTSAKQGCPKCAKVISKGELELLEFVKSCLVEKYGSLPEITTNKSPTFFPNKQHLDVYIPSLKISFEYNGEYWHCGEKGRDEDYHSNKSKWCSSAGVELIHIWEDDWKNDKENMKRMVQITLNHSQACCQYSTVTVAVAMAVFW